MNAQQQQSARDMNALVTAGLDGHKQVFAEIVREADAEGRLGTVVYALAGLTSGLLRAVAEKEGTTPQHVWSGLAQVVTRIVEEDQ